MEKSYLWYDYETFGTDPKRDRISQFAGVRTDQNFNIIDEMVYYCRLAEDYLPNPEACLITGITPQEANEKGITENQLSEIIFTEFTREGTTTVGYNSIKFDDEVTRNLFYRTFRDPYEREWKNSCFRWDFMRAVLGAYVMKPEILIWPQKDNGRPSFRLEELSAANGIVHENAHDAKSDVYATIGLAKRIFTTSPKVYDYFFKLRDKGFVKEILDKDKIFLHIDFGYGYEKGYCSLLYKVGDFSDNGDKNAFLFIDLGTDLELLGSMGVGDIKNLLYAPGEELLEKGKERPGLKQIRMNQSPILFPYKNLREIPDAMKGLGEVLEEKEEKAARIADERRGDLFKVFEKEESQDVGVDPDLDIYGKFAGWREKNEMKALHESGYTYRPNFKGEKYMEMYFRFMGRNMNELMSAEDRRKWKEFCRNRISWEREGYQNIDSLRGEISDLKEECKHDRKKIDILSDIAEYMEGLEKDLVPQDHLEGIKSSDKKKIVPGKQLKMF